MPNENRECMRTEQCSHNRHLARFEHTTMLVQCFVTCRTSAALITIFLRILIDIWRMREASCTGTATSPRSPYGILSAPPYRPLFRVPPRRNYPQSCWCIIQIILKSIIYTCTIVDRQTFTYRFSCFQFYISRKISCVPQIQTSRNAVSL
jgi:hypothetical protein